MLVACRVIEDEDSTVRYFLCSGQTEEEILEAIKQEEFDNGLVRVEIYKRTLAIDYHVSCNFETLGIHTDED